MWAFSDHLSLIDIVRARAAPAPIASLAMNLFPNCSRGVDTVATDSQGIVTQIYGGPWSFV